MAIYNPRQMWFGTLDRMQWIRTPLSGAEVSGEGFHASGTLLNGGGYGRHSWNTHRVYTYEWPASSPGQDIQTIHSYRSGVYGRGLLYWIEPNVMDKNVLPLRWSSPAVACGDETTHVYGVYPDETSVSGGEANGLPVSAAYYDLSSVSAGYRSDLETVFLPIPPGYTAYVGAVYSATGSAKVYVTPVDSNGNNGTAQALTEVGVADADLHPDTFTGGKGIRLWVGKGGSGTATLTWVATSIRMVPTSKTLDVNGPWIAGMGHAGCRFDGPVSQTNNNGVNGGQFGIAATFREVGN